MKDPLDRIRLSSLSSSARQQLRSLHIRRPWLSMAYYAGIYAAIAAIWAVCLLMDSLLIWAAGVWFIAVTQQSLYIINHDASHFGHFHSRFKNRWVAFALCVVPMFHHPEAWSYEHWQRRHVLHHRHLFTLNDPDYANRVRQGDNERVYTRWTLLWACTQTGLLSLWALFTGRQDVLKPNTEGVKFSAPLHLRALFFSFHSDSLLEKERRLKWLGFILILSMVHSLGLWLPFIVLWIVPMHSVYPAMLHLSDLTEHKWQSREQSIVANSRSTSCGLLTRLLIMWFPRPHHREHHLFPGVLVGNLPKVARMLRAEGLVPPCLVGVPELLGSVTHAK